MFKRKKKETDNVFQKLHHCCIKCVSVKDLKTYRETIIGREGTVHISENELVIVCQNTEVFRKSIDVLQIAELMSHDGFTICDLQDPEQKLYMVYYVK